jgi:hypothetical protein
MRLLFIILLIIAFFTFQYWEPPFINFWNTVVVHQWNVIVHLTHH